MTLHFSTEVSGGARQAESRNNAMGPRDRQWETKWEQRNQLQDMVCGPTWPAQVIALICMPLREMRVPARESSMQEPSCLPGGEDNG